MKKVCQELFKFVALSGGYFWQNNFLFQSIQLLCISASRLSENYARKKTACATPLKQAVRFPFLNSILYGVVRFKV
jgi:hypothetical protein